MSQVDNEILDINGKCSPALEGLPVAPDVLAIAASSAEVGASYSLTLERMEEDVATQPVESNSSDQLEANSQQSAASSQLSARSGHPLS